MGACLSQSATAANHGAVVHHTKSSYTGHSTFKNNVAATPNNGRGSGLFRKGNAYELAIVVSPSERTHATRAMTPFGIEEDEELVNVSELDIPFDEKKEDKDEQSPWDEEGDEDEDTRDCDVEYDHQEHWVPQNIYERTPESHIMDHDEEEEDEDDGHDSPRDVEMDMSHQMYSLTAATPVTKTEKKRGLFSSIKMTKRPDPPSGVFFDDGEDEAVPIETPQPITPGNNTPLLAPPKGVPVTFDSVVPSSSHQRAVTPQTVSSFNKMKSQAQQAEKLEKQQRQKDKIKDRRQDIQGYNELWEEYSAIQEKVTEQDVGSVISAEPSTCEKISIADTTTWFVDFSSMSVNGQLMDLDDEDDDARSTSSYSLHSEMSENAQREFFKQKARKRRVSMGKSDSMEDMNSSICDKRSIVMSDNHSVVSDVSSENGSLVERNDDYGVLHKFRHKSIEQSVMDYEEYFSETPGHTPGDMTYQSSYSAVQHVVSAEIREEVQGYSDVYSEAPTPKTVNSRAVSIGSYLEEMALPSVSIEDGKTGKVRWRQFPKKEERAKTARKLEFQDEAANQTKKHDKPKTKPRIKTYDPVISSLSTDDFYRVSSFKNGIRHIKSNSHVPKMTNVENTETSSIVAGDELLVAPSTSEHLKERRDLLARKVGTKLESLIAQLKENGLGE